MTTTLVTAAVAGAAFGVLYFGILWHSTRTLTATGGFRTFALAAFARLVLVLSGLAVFFMLSGAASDLVAAAFGFIAAREAIKRMVSHKRVEG